MAQYTEKQYAIDSYQKNWNTGEITRNDIVSATSYYSFTTHDLDSYPLISADEIHILYPAKNVIDKKRYIKTDYYIYVISNVSSESHSLLSGQFIRGINYEAKPFEKYVGNDWINKYDNLRTIYTQQYNKIRFENISVFTSATENMIASTKYDLKNRLDVHSHTNTYPPYRIETYDDVIPFASNIIPSKFLDKKVSNTFKWNFDYDKTNVIGTLKQKSAKFRYRNVGNTNYTEVLIDGETSEYTLPANTFAGNSVQWQVIVTSDDGIESTQTEWITLTTIDSNPISEAIFPNGVLIDSTKDNAFMWNHIIDTNTPQTKFDLQYTVNGTDWITLASETTSRQNYTVPANTFKDEQIKWRVRTYNTDGVSSSWSNIAGVVIKQAPDMPNLISVENKARPIIAWGAIGQEAFRIEVLSNNDIIYQSDLIVINKKQFKIPIYLNDGDYTIKLYITNKYGMESKPLIVNIAISTIKPPAPIVTATNVDNGIKLTISKSSSDAKMYILRNGVPIKKLMNETEWFDYSANKDNKYIVRVIDANDNFNDSEPIMAITSIKYATIAPITNTSAIVNLKHTRGNPLIHRGSVNLIGDNHYFAGRPLPVYEFSEHLNEIKQFNYTFRFQNGFDLFKQLVLLRNTVIYRNNRGETIYGIITSFEYQSDKYSTDVSFNIQKCDYSEAINYDLEV